MKKNFNQMINSKCNDLVPDSLIVKKTDLLNNRSYYKNLIIKQLKIKATYFKQNAAYTINFKNKRFFEYNDLIQCLSTNLPIF